MTSAGQVSRVCVFGGVRGDSEWVEVVSGCLWQRDDCDKQLCNGRSLFILLQKKPVKAIAR